MNVDAQCDAALLEELEADFSIDDYYLPPPLNTAPKAPISPLLPPPPPPEPLSAASPPSSSPSSTLREWQLRAVGPRESCPPRVTTRSHEECARELERLRHARGSVWQFVCARPFSGGSSCPNFKIVSQSVTWKTGRGAARALGRQAAATERGPTVRDAGAPSGVCV